MKIKIIAIFLTFSTSVFSQTVGEVRELSSLRDSWIRAREQALKPIDDKYASALRALKDKLTKSGDLEGALQVDAELKQRTQSLEQLPAVATLSKFAGTSWENRQAGSQIDFLTRGRFLEEFGGNKSPGTWKLSSDPDTVEVIYDQDKTKTLVYKLNSKNQILTRSDNLIYTPIK